MSSRNEVHGRPLNTAAGPIDASVEVPGSKSISNRALICAALADGESSVINIAPGDDTKAMLRALRDLDVALRFDESVVEILGSGGNFDGGCVVDAGLAGTTSRFLTALATLAKDPVTVTGREALLRRPMGDLHRALSMLGAEVRHLGQLDHLPVEIGKGHIRGGSISLKGDISSQFLTALMLIGPYLDTGLEIELTSKLVSRPYVDMTARVMSTFGVPDVVMEEDIVVVPPGRYTGCVYTVEPDASSASYPLAAAAIAGGRVAVRGLTPDSMQGDIRILEILETMGCTVESTQDSSAVHREHDLRGIDVDMADVSDLVPTVAVLAMFASSPSRIRGVGFIRNKESDRLGDLVAGIELLGGRAVEHHDGVEVLPRVGLPEFPVVAPTHHDHRLAMAWSLVALRRPGITIDDPDVVDKSWPGWWSVRDLILRSSFQ